MKKSCLSLMVLLIILLVAGPLSAQSGSVKGKESWNRAVEAVSVMPSALPPLLPMRMVPTP